jgi:hypothetical protein
MTSYQTIVRLDGSRVQARYIRHITTLTPPLGDEDIDVYRTKNGEEIACSSSRIDCRPAPQEIESTPTFRMP